MKILVDRLTETPTVHRFEADRAWWAEARPLSPELVDDGEAPCMELRAYRVGAELVLEGTLRAELAQTCSRCLATYRDPVKEQFRLILEPAGDRVPAEPEAARALARDGLCLGDELEAGWYRGGEVQLGAFSREVLAGVIPVKPLCREDCRGLCPQCGTDRNVEECHCVGQSAQSPFAVLQALRSAPSKGES